jgi:hypothetical protein
MSKTGEISLMIPKQGMERLIKACRDIIQAYNHEFPIKYDALRELDRSLKHCLPYSAHEMIEEAIKNHPEYEHYFRAFARRAPLQFLADQITDFLSYMDSLPDKEKYQWQKIVIGPDPGTPPEEPDRGSGRGDGGD